MRCAGHILLNVITVLSLLLCVVTVTLWLRSYSRGDFVRRTDVRPIGDGFEQDQFAFMCKPRRIIFVMAGTRAAANTLVGEHLHDRASEFGGIPQWSWRVDAAAEPDWFDDWLGDPSSRGWGPVRWASWPTPSGQFSNYVHVVGINYWLAAALMAALPAARAFGRVRRRRHGGMSGSHCRECGYDLRATPERCPECGRVYS